ncbi:MAG: class I SAM-dependent methyltransferase [Hyphomicrobiales bacterium]
MSETPLEAELKRQIAKTGPVPISEYMAMALGHPAHGYYMGRDPFGARGDFITAPEVSQIFGELVGIWCAAAFQMTGAPASFNLVELGPGRGTLMADMLRAANIMPGFKEAANVHLVETSPALKQNQKVKLASAGVPLAWHDTFEAVPEGPAIVVANEFFDALPVKQMQRAGEHWHERVVGLDAEGALAFGLSAQVLPKDTIPVWAAEAEDGAIIELSPVREGVAELIGARLVQQGGFGLFIDYGHVNSAPGDTLQALSKHQYAEILHRPGYCDITSHVDFEALGKAFQRSGASVFGPVSQGPFLDAMGLDVRAERLSRDANRRQARAIEAAVTRLASRQEMGELFKVMAVGAPGAPIPAPFEGLSG